MVNKIIIALQAQPEIRTKSKKLYDKIMAIDGEGYSALMYKVISRVSESTMHKIWEMQEDLKDDQEEQER